MELINIHAKAVSADFVRPWQTMPSDIRDFYNHVDGKSLAHLFSEAAERLNRFNLPQVSEKHFKDALIASLASEVWKVIPENEKEEFFSGKHSTTASDSLKMFREILGIMRESLSASEPDRKEKP